MPTHSWRKIAISLIDGTVVQRLISTAGGGWADLALSTARGHRRTEFCEVCQGTISGRVSKIALFATVVPC